MGASDDNSAFGSPLTRFIKLSPHIQIEQAINPDLCEIAPAPRLEHLKVSQYSYEFNTYHGPMKSVYIKDFCSNPIFISPKYDKQMAIELQTALENLALQDR